MSTKRTYQPHKLSAKRKFGFMSKNKTKVGRKILRRRALKGRKEV